MPMPHPLPTYTMTHQELAKTVLENITPEQGLDPESLASLKEIASETRPPEQRSPELKTAEFAVLQDAVETFEGMSWYSSLTRVGPSLVKVETLFNGPSQL